MTETARTWHILRIALAITGLVVLFFSGIFPIENYLALVPSNALTASVVPSDVATLTNTNRIEKGLPALTINPLLSQAAQRKAEDMAQHSYYAHISPDGKSPLYWLQQVGYKYLNAGENLVIDRTTSEDAVSAWMNSPDHRENILRPQFTEFGIGVAEGVYDGQPTIFIVQEFGTPYPLSAPALRTPPKPIVAVEPLKKTQLITNIEALAAPVAKTIAPASVEKTVKIPPKERVRLAIVPGTIGTSTVPLSSTTTATSSLTTFSYALAAEFYAPVQVARSNERIGPVEKGTVPQIQNPTPTWLISVRHYLQSVTNFVPRIW